MFKKTPRLQNEAVAADVGGAGAPAAPTEAPAAPVAAPAPAAAPAAPTTIMSKGAAPAAPAEWNAPDKYLVKGEGGDVDWQATARKIDEGRSHLEKRMGSGDVPPADVSGYKVEAPADYAEALKGWNPAEDAKLSEFLADAHDPAHPELAQDLLDSYAAEHKSRQSQAELVLNGIGIKVLSDEYEADDNLPDDRYGYPA